MAHPEYSVSDNDWISRYKFIQPIGQGGMGTVFLAEDRKDGNATRVVKQLIHRSTGDEFERRESVRLFMREAEILQTLDHDGIVKVYDHHASEDGKYFLVMEFVPGRNLEMIVNTNGPLNNDLVTRIAIQCCDVLEYLHAQKDPIIYRDLKPSNLMLTPDGRIVFIDFGIARQLMPKEAATRVVTAGYSPPEQYFGRQDTRSDIYSLGATLGHLLTGVRPKPLTQCNPAVHNPMVLPGLNSLILRMTAHEVDDRPVNARAVRYGLYKIYKELHPEWEMPDMPDAELYDERALAAEAARQKFGKGQPTPAHGIGKLSGNIMAQLRGDTPQGRQSTGGTPVKPQNVVRGVQSNGRQPHIGNRVSQTNNREQHSGDTTEVITEFVQRVKRWFESALRRE